MSDLKELLSRHRCDVSRLRGRCQHRERDITIREDHSVVGCGSAYPSIHVVCRNCGAKKIIFRSGETELKKKVKKTLKRQGFADERMDLAIQYDWELD